MEYLKDIKEIGQRLQDRRKEFFKTQYEFAEALGIEERKTIGNWETGTVAIPIHRLSDICNLLDCDLDYLFGKIDVPKNNTADIMKETGLSQKAVEKAVAWKSTDDYRRFWNDYISAIIESDKFENLLFDISKLLGYSKWEIKSVNEDNPAQAIEFFNLQTAQLWYISKTFTDIIEDIEHNERLKDGVKNGNNK